MLKRVVGFFYTFVLIHRVHRVMSRKNCSIGEAIEHLAKDKLGSRFVTKEQANLAVQRLKKDSHAQVYAPHSRTDEDSSSDGGNHSYSFRVHDFGQRGPSCSGYDGDYYDAYATGHDDGYNASRQDFEASCG